MDCSVKYGLFYTLGEPDFGIIVMFFTTRGDTMSNYQFEQLIWQMQDQVKIDPAKVGAWRDFAHAKVMAGNMGGVFNEQAQI